jgi:phosphoglucosamine mutase
VPLDTIPAVQEKIDDIERRLRGRGRIVVRYSGTEPLLRVMVESDDASLNQRMVEEFLVTLRVYLL